MACFPPLLSGELLPLLLLPLLLLLLLLLLLPLLNLLAASLFSCIIKFDFPNQALPFCVIFHVLHECTEDNGIRTIHNVCNAPLGFVCLRAFLLVGIGQRVPLELVYPEFIT
jgi:hypothetical protein